MMSPHRLGAAKADRVAYYVDLARQDYYTQGGEPPGQWLGLGRAALGLEGAATPEQLRRIMRGEHPHTGEGLVRGAGDNHVAGTDCTFSSGKPVGVLWAMCGDDRRREIGAAHHAAVGTAVRYLETHAAFTRVGKDGVDVQRVQGLIAAVYEHSTSRNVEGELPDPNLHSHALIANLAQREDGKWGCIEAKYIFEAQKAAGAIYRAELASRLRELGLAATADESTIQIEGVPQDVCDYYSKRRKDVLRRLEAKGETGPAAAEAACLESRVAKAEIDRPALSAAWKQQGAALGFGQAEAEALFGGVADIEVPEIKNEAILAKLTEQASTFRAADLHAVVGSLYGGTLDGAGVEAKADELLAGGEIVTLRAADGSTRYSTREMMRIERTMADRCEQRRGEGLIAVGDDAIRRAVESRSMREDQRAAFDHLVAGADGVACVTGMAGSGKSYMLGAAREAWEAAGFRVRGAALAGKAADGLQNDAGIESSTVHSLLLALDEGRERLSERDVIVVDEAGMLGSRLMARLLEKANTAGSKVCLVGDARQLQPIDAGGSFRAITNRIGAVEIKHITRQREAWAKQAVHDFADGEAATALAAYAERGLLHIANTRDEAADRLVAQWAADGGMENPREALMLAGTRREVRRLNDLARERMREAGMLGDDVGVPTEDGELALATGDRIVFGKNSKLLGVKNGSFARVESIKGEGADAVLTARLDSGATVRWRASEYGHVSRGLAATVHRSQGATVDRTYILGGIMADRELSYVQFSRHRIEAHIFLEREEIAEAMQAVPPTEKMLALAESLGAPEEVGESFALCRRWLDQHSGRELGLDGDREHELLRQIPQAVFRMSQSRQKDSTLDYAEALPQRGRAPAPELLAEPGDVSDLAASRHHQPPDDQQPDPAEQPAEQQQQPRPRLRRGLSL